MNKHSPTSHTLVATLAKRDAAECHRPLIQRQPETVRDLLRRIQAGELLMVNSRRKNGLILGKRFHAEFAGPGAAIGGALDVDCEWLIPIGNLAWAVPTSLQEQEKALLIRRQWIKLIAKHFTESETPLDCACNLLDHFEGYFDVATVHQSPAEAWAGLIGVFPETIIRARQSLSQLA